MSSIVVESYAATADYRRQARRIRASFATQPLLRHHALNNLARQHDAARPSSLANRVIKTSARRIAPDKSRYLPSEPGTATSAVERGFADHSADRLRAGAFTFSDRIHLLDMAEKLGIPRFRANLILALEQHRINPPPIAVTSPKDTPQSLMPHLLSIMLIEAIVVGLFVWVCTL